MPTILSISKRETSIYNFLNLIFFVSFSSFAADDLASFCFEPNVSLQSVKDSIGFILLEKDTVSFREDEHCLDIIVSDKRKNVLDKYLSKKYKLIGEAAKERPECHIELKTITKTKQTTNDFKLGLKNNLSVNDSSTNAVTSAEMLLGAGFSGKLATGEQVIQVECHPIGADAFSLIFYFEEKNRAQVSTSVMLNKNETMNLASVKKTLDEKNKILGIPQTAIKNIEGNEETNYELKVY